MYTRENCKLLFCYFKMYNVPTQFLSIDIIQAIINNQQHTTNDFRVLMPNNRVFENSRNKLLLSSTTLHSVNTRFYHYIPRRCSSRATNPSPSPSSRSFIHPPETIVSE